MIVRWRLGFDLTSRGLGISASLVIDLATDPVVRTFLQEVVKLGGVAKDGEDFMLHKPALPVQITMACSLFTGTKINLRYRQAEERDVVRDAYFISAIWRLPGTNIRDWRRDDGNQMALLNALYVGTGQPLERVLHARQIAPPDKGIPLVQTTLRGAACTFEPVAKLGEFTSFYATQLTSRRRQQISIRLLRGR